MYVIFVDSCPGSTNDEAPLASGQCGLMAIATSSVGENAIELITADRGPHYEPFGWHHWPEHPWLAYQFRDATLRVQGPDETGAEHCQHDNLTIGQEVLADWLADRFGIDQRALLKTSWNPLL